MRIYVTLLSFMMTCLAALAFGEAPVQANPSLHNTIWSSEDHNSFEDWTHFDVCPSNTPTRIPLSEGAFDGLIVTSAVDGVRAIRASVPTPYILAYRDHYRSFADMGSMSPDGRWFAFPSGYSGQSNWLDRYYIFQQTNFVDTYTGMRVFSVPVYGAIDFVSGYFYYSPSMRTGGWLGSDTFIAPGESDYEREPALIDVRTRGATSYTGSLTITEVYGYPVSPNGQYAAKNGVLYDLASATQITTGLGSVTFLQNGSGYLSLNLETNVLQRYAFSDRLLNREWLLGEDVFFMDVSRGGRWLVLQERTTSGSLVYRLVDTEDERVMTICEEAESYRVSSAVIGPDETYAVVLTTVRAHTDRADLHFINLETGTVDTLDIWLDFSNHLVGWWSLPE